MSEWNPDLEDAPYEERVLVSAVGFMGEPKVYRATKLDPGWWSSTDDDPDGERIVPYAWMPMPDPAPLPEGGGE